MQKKNAYAIINIGSLWNFTKHLHANPRNLTSYLHRNPPEPHQASSPPKSSGTSQSLCTGTFRNLTRYLHRNPPEPHRGPAPETSGTSQGICTATLRNLTEDLHRRLPEPHKVSAREPSREPHRTLQSLSRSSQEPSRTSLGTLRNLTRYLNQNPPKPCPEPGEAAPDRTGANLG